MDAPRLRPLAIGEVIDVSIKLYRAHFVTLVKAVSIVVAPVAVLSALIQDAAQSSLVIPDTETLAPGVEPVQLPDASDIVRFFAAILLSVVLAVIGQVLAAGAAFRALAEGYLGRKADWRDSLRFALARFGPLLWVSVLASGLALLAAIPLIVPGVWLYVAWTVSTPALLFEDARGRRALGRSFTLVKGRWWPTFAAVLLAAILASIVQGVIAAGLFGTVFIGVSDTPVLGPFIDAVANTVSQALTLPFVAAVTAVLYFDLRVRKEGFDIELLAQGIGAPAATESDDDLWGSGWSASPPEPGPTDTGRWGEPLGPPPGPPSADPLKDD